MSGKKSIAQQLLDTRAKKNVEKSQNLSESLSRMVAPAVQHKTSTEPGASFSEIYLVPTLPEKSTLKQRVSLALYFASVLRAPKELSSKEAVVVLIGLFDILYRPLTRKSLKIEWNEIVLTRAQLLELDAFIADGKTLGPAGGPGYHNNRNAFIAKHQLPQTAQIGMVSSDFFETERDPLMFYGYAGLLLFSLHKDPDGQGKNALTLARPNALREKYKKTKEAFVLWNAKGIPTEKGWSAISGIWNLIPTTKFNWFERFIEFGKETVGAEDEALFLSVRLMRFSDLSHVALITQALNEFDVIRAYPPLAGELEAFGAGIRQMYELAPIVRSATGAIQLDEHGRPLKDTYYLAYLKVLYGDKKDIAKRNTMPFLLVCCVRLLISNHPELANYTIPAGYDNRFNDFRLWKDEVETEMQALDT